MSLTPKDNRPDVAAPRVIEQEWMPIAEWLDRHHQQLEDPARDGAQLVFLGDSISQDFDPELWQTYATHKPLNLGIGGDETQHVLWRIEQGTLDGLAPRVLVLLIGTNNFGNNTHEPDGVARGIRAIVDQVTERLPTTKVLLMGIFPRDPRADSPLRTQINQTNALIARFADSQRVHYLNIGDHFLDEHGNLPESLMPDNLHPNQAGYQVWIDGMRPLLNSLLEE